MSEIEPPERSVDEIEDIVDDLRETVNDQAGREFIEKMVDADNRVMQAPYGNEIVELIAPRSMTQEIEDLCDEWDLNPAGPGVMAQAPSFEEQRPEISEALVSFQFLLDGDELSSCGYDLETIMDELASEPVLATKAPSVKATLPW